MKINLEFDPQVDSRSSVMAAVDAMYVDSPLKPSASARTEFAEPITVLADQKLQVTTDANHNITEFGVINPALELDVDGVPWDARIHSDAVERQTAAGRWKKRRGVDASEYDAITRELQLLASSKVGTAELPIPTLADAKIDTEETPIVEVAPEQFETVAAQEVAPPMPPPVLPVADKVPETHVELMTWIGTRLASKQLTADDVRKVCTAGNLESMGALEHMGADWIKWAYDSLLLEVK